MAEQELLDFTGIRYYDQYFRKKAAEGLATREDLEALLRLAGTLFRYCGSVASVEDLPAEGNHAGDVWNIGIDPETLKPVFTGENYAWTSAGWDRLSLDLHLENYVRDDQYPDTKPGVLSPELAKKLEDIKAWATRVAIDEEPSLAWDGDEAALLGSSLTIYAVNADGDSLAVGSGSSYRKAGPHKPVFWVPLDSVPSGDAIEVSVPVLLSGSERAEKIKAAHVHEGDTGAFSYEPGAAASYTGLQLYVEWLPETGLTDGPTTEFGTFDVSWLVNGSAGGVRLDVTWHAPGNVTGTVMVSRGTLPIGINRLRAHPGVPRSITVAVPEGSSSTVSLTAKINPLAGNPFTGGELDSSAEGMTYDCSQLSRDALPWQTFSGIPVDVDWTGTGHDDDTKLGTFSATWLYVKDGLYTATLSWDRWGPLTGRLLDAEVRAGGGSGASVGTLEDAEVAAFYPLFVRAKTDATSAGNLMRLSGEIAMPGTGVLHARLNPSAEGVLFDGSSLKAVGKYKEFRGIRLDVEWENPDGEHVDGPTEEFGTFMVTWTLAGVTYSGGRAAGRQYDVSISWEPPVFRAWHVLSEAATVRALADKLGPDDVASASKNGVMSAADKRKLDGIAENANNWKAEDHKASAEELGVVRVDARLSGSSENPVQTASVYAEMQDKLSGSAADCATASKNGTMSGDDKAKLESVEPLANNWQAEDNVATSVKLGVVLVDEELDAESENPVQNGAIYDELEDKIGREALADDTHDGTISGEDQAKLNSCEWNAGHGDPENPDVYTVIVDDEIAESENPVQTAVVKEALDALDGDFSGILSRKDVYQTASGYYRFENAVGASISGTAGTAGRLSGSPKIAVTGSMEGGPVVFDGSQDVVINASIDGLVPAAAPEDMKLPLGIDADGSPSWGAGNAGLLAKTGNQTVWTEKNFESTPVVQGPKDDGTAFLGVVQTVEDLPESPAPNDVYLVAGTVGRYYCWSETTPGSGVYAWTAIPSDPGNPPRGMQGAPLFYVKDEFRSRIERATGGENTVVYDACGNPHVMVVMPRFNLEDIDPALGTGTHPAFVFSDGTASELLIGKYLASLPKKVFPNNNSFQLCTLPGREPLLFGGMASSPASAIPNVLGSRFSYETVYARGARSIWVHKERGQSVRYDGNTDSGRSRYRRWQTGVMASCIMVPGSSEILHTGVTLTGSGPAEWNDNGRDTGICDYVGNVREFLAGLGFNSGKFQIASSHSAAWNMNSGTSNLKYVGKDGIQSGSTGALFVTMSGGVPVLAASGSFSGSNSGFDFRDISIPASLDGSGVMLLKALGLLPIDGFERGRWFLRSGSSSTMVQTCGGSWADTLYYKENLTDYSIGPFSMWNEQQNYASWNVRGTAGMRLVYRP